MIKNLDLSNPADWGPLAEELTALGWELRGETRFRPMLGRSIVVKASQAGSGREVEVEGATLKIALKKIKKRIG